MKKSLLFLCCLFLIGCVAAEKAIPFTGEQAYAVAYLGYEEPTELAYYEAAYDLENVPVHHVSGGEYYLVIPRYDNTRLRLYRNDLTSGEETLLYEDPNCEAFVLCCNVSDIFPDVTVQLTSGTETVEFTPYLSLKDGSVQIGEQGLLLEAK